MKKNLSIAAERLMTTSLGKPPLNLVLILDSILRHTLSGKKLSGISKRSVIQLSI